MKRIFIIKIGGSVLLTKDHKFDEVHLSHIAEQLVALQKRGIGVVLVVSGAVAYGSNIIDLSERLSYKRQAAAGVGQINVITMFEKLFKKYGVEIAQLLITKQTFLSSQQELKRLIEFYVSSQIIPIINENDPMDLNSFGGNDLLAGEIAKLLLADKLIMLSTMERSVHATGGGATKYETISLLRDNCIDACIVEGRKKNVLLDLI